MGCGRVIEALEATLLKPWPGGGEAEVTKTTFEELKRVSPQFAEAVEVAKSARAMLMKTHAVVCTICWFMARLVVTGPSENQLKSALVTKLRDLIQRSKTLFPNIGAKS